MLVACRMQIKIEERKDQATVQIRVSESAVTVNSAATSWLGIWLDA